MTVIPSYLANRWSLLVAILLVSLAGLAWWWVPARVASPPLMAVTIAWPVQTSIGGLIVAIDHQLPRQHGLEIASKKFLLGKDALDSVLQGKADLALVADTPFMLAVMRGERIATVATIFASRRTMALVAREGRAIDTPAALGGKRIGTVMGTNAQYFLDSLLQGHGVASSDATVVALKAEHIVSALRDGTVDAVTVWNPDLSRLQHEFGSGIRTFYGDDLFVYRFLLVGKQDYLESHPNQVRAVLRTMDEGNRLIKDQPMAAAATISREIGLSQAEMARSFDAADFGLSLDQSLLLALSAQSRWAIAKGIVPAAHIPNFLDALRTAPLEAVAPDAVRIIR
jgi:NitT/TauT family transport system substrate-binding protein